MGKINPKHRKRLKNLLSSIGINGVLLAKKTGTSYPLFLKVSGGKRNITAEYAEKITIATGVDPNWLLGKHGEDGEPIGLVEEGGASRRRSSLSRGKAARCCDKAYYQEWNRKGGSTIWLSDIKPTDESAIAYDAQKMIWRLAYLMYGCLRSNRLGLLRYYFNKLDDSLTEDFQLEPHHYNVDFLEDNPYRYTYTKMSEALRKRILSRRIDKRLYRTIKTPVNAQGLEDPSVVYHITGIFNPFFLIKISEALKNRDKRLVTENLNIAKEALNVLWGNLT